MTTKPSDTTFSSALRLRVESALPYLATIVALFYGTASSWALDVHTDPVPRIPLPKDVSRPFLIHLFNAGQDCRGTVASQDLPATLSAEPKKQTFELKRGEEKLLVFHIRCVEWGEAADIRPTVTVEGDEPVTFPEHLKTHILHARVISGVNFNSKFKLDAEPLEDGLLAYYSCGDNPSGKHQDFDKCVGFAHCWSEGFWAHAGGVKGRCLFRYSGEPYPRLGWSKLAFEPFGNIDHRRGTFLFWMRQSLRTREIAYKKDFNPDPRATRTIDPRIGYMGIGEGLFSANWTPQTVSGP